MAAAGGRSNPESLRAPLGATPSQDPLGGLDMAGPLVGLAVGLSSAGSGRGRIPSERTSTGLSLGDHLPGIPALPLISGKRRARSADLGVLLWASNGARIAPSSLGC